MFTEMRLQSYDVRAFDPMSGPFQYDIYEPIGKSYKQVDFWAALATERLCITVGDFLAIFGADAERETATDDGGFGYTYEVKKKNQIRVRGFFGHLECMQDLSMSQNMDRLGE